MNDKQTRKVGRPVGYRAENPSNKMLPVKVTEDQLTTYKAAAEKRGSSFSAWVRDTLDKAAKKVKWWNMQKCFLLVIRD